MPGMAITLAIVGVAFAAFCVWLGVRIVNRRERWAKWMLATVVGLPVLYVASFGPVCWWFIKASSPVTFTPRNAIDSFPHAPHFFWPVGWLAQNGPKPLLRAIEWYATRRAPVVYIPADFGGTTLVAVYAGGVVIQNQPEVDEMPTY
jgi:hypothetical protein